jgi:RNA recognition motif-containing protein
MSRLYVGNISSKANMDEVHDLFLECGKLKSFNIQDGSGYIVNTISLVYLYII